ncbi:MAG: hypothetical protein ACLPXB_09200 [Thiobacillaceae bacterium]
MIKLTSGTFSRQQERMYAQLALGDCENPLFRHARSSHAPARESTTRRPSPNNGTPSGDTGMAPDVSYPPPSTASMGAPCAGDMAPLHAHPAIFGLVIVPAELRSLA